MKTKLNILVIMLLISITMFGYGYYFKKGVFADQLINTSNSDKKGSILEVHDSTVRIALVELLKPFKNSKSMYAKYKTILLNEKTGIDLGSFECIYAKNEKGIYQKSIESENLVTEKYLLAVDKEMKCIFLENNTSGVGALMESSYLFDINSILELNDSSVKLSEKTNGVAIITVNLNLGNYYKVEFVYLKDKNELKEIRLFPFRDLFNDVLGEGEISASTPDGFISPDLIGNEDEIVIILRYDEILIDKPISDKYFDISRFVQFKKDSPIGVNSFKNYEIEYEN